MSPRSDAERRALADEHDAADLAAHARLLGDDDLFREAKARMAEAQERAAAARRARLRVDAAAEVLTLPDWADMVPLPDFDLQRLSAADRGPGEIFDSFGARGFTLSRLTAPHEPVVRVHLANPDRRLAGWLLPLAVLAEARVDHYLVPLHEGLGGESGAEGSLTIREPLPVVRMRIGRQLLPPEALGEAHVQVVRRSLVDLPRRAQAAWTQIAESRPHGDRLRAAIEAGLR